MTHTILSITLYVQTLVVADIAGSMSKPFGRFRKQRLDLYMILLNYPLLWVIGFFDNTVRYLRGFHVTVWFFGLISMVYLTIGAIEQTRNESVGTIIIIYGSMIALWFIYVAYSVYLWR